MGDKLSVNSHQLDNKGEMTLSAECPPKKLARQLDFNGTAAVSREHSQPQTVVQTMPRAGAAPVLPPQTPYSAARAVKSESPKIKPRITANAKDGTPKKQKQCNCKHSRCLKLYCECFANGLYCDGCNCANCHNNVEYESCRQAAVEATLERNPNAFRPKIASSPRGLHDRREDAIEVPILGKHNKGCHCKKSSCLKKYCECFQANIPCSDNCKCVDCKNFEGSEERQALFHGDRANNMVFIQQAANAAISGAIGSSGFASTPLSRKRSCQELFFGSMAGDSSLQKIQFQQPNRRRPPEAPSALSPTMVTCAGALPTLGSKITYRSLLAGVIQPQDIREFCSALVVASREAAKKLSEQKNKMEKQVKIETNAKEADSSDNDESCSGDNDSCYRRPLSPGTLALMCNEDDIVLMAGESPERVMDLNRSSSSQIPNGHLEEAYVEQEKLVLLTLQNYLNKLITIGEMKGTKCSSLAQAGSGDISDLVDRGTRQGWIAAGNHLGTGGNGVAKTVHLPARASQMDMGAVSASNRNLLETQSVTEFGLT